MLGTQMLHMKLRRKDTIHATAKAAAILMLAKRKNKLKLVELIKSSYDTGISWSKVTETFPSQTYSKGALQFYNQ